MCEIYIYIKFTHTHTHTYTRAHKHTHTTNLSLRGKCHQFSLPQSVFLRTVFNPFFGQFTMMAKTCLLFPHAPPVLARRAHFSDAPPLMSRQTQRVPPAFQGTPSIKRAPPLSCKARRASTTRPLLSQTRPCIPVLHIRTVLDAANSPLIIHISTWSRNM